MMKKFLMFLTAMIIYSSAVALAAESPTCAMMKFSNDTRFQGLDCENLLSELVMEKLLASGKFNLVETKPIDKDLETILYDEKIHEIMNLKRGLSQGNFNELFEGSGFDPKQAESIRTARVGQIISPSIVSKIGNENQAEYLIQGTIINLGKNTWNDSNIIGNVLGTFMRAIGKSDTVKGVGESLANNQTKTSVICLQTDLRVIRAATGEVIWRTQISGYSGKSVTGKNAYLQKIKLESETYASLIENAADEIAKSLIKQLEDGKLFEQ